MIVMKVPRCFGMIAEVYRLECSGCRYACLCTIVALMKAGVNKRGFN